MFQPVFNLVWVAPLDTGQNSYMYALYFYNRIRLMLASSCNSVQSPYFKFIHSVLLTGTFYVLQIKIMLLDCTCHIFNFVKLTVKWLTIDVAPKCSFLLFFYCYRIFDLGYSGSESLG